MLLKYLEFAAVLALTPDPDGVCEVDGVEGGDGAGVLPAVLTLRQPAHQHVALLNGLQLAPAFLFIKYIYFSH